MFGVTTKPEYMRPRLAIAFVKSQIHNWSVVTDMFGSMYKSHDSAPPHRYSRHDSLLGGTLSLTCLYRLTCAHDLWLAIVCPVTEQRWRQQIVVASARHKNRLQYRRTDEEKFSSRVSCVCVTGVALRGCSWRNLALLIWADWSECVYVRLAKGYALHSNTWRLAELNKKPQPSELIPFSSDAREQTSANAGGLIVAREDDKMR